MYVFDGGRLAEFRKAAGLSQESIAQSLKTSQQTVGRWENGKSEPGLSHLFALADMYGVTLDELVSRPDSGTTQTTPLPLDFAITPDPAARALSLAELSKILSSIRRIITAADALNLIFPQEVNPKGSDESSKMEQ